MDQLTMRVTDRDQRQSAGAGGEAELVHGFLYGDRINVTEHCIAKVKIFKLKLS